MGVSVCHANEINLRWFQKKSRVYVFVNMFNYYVNNECTFNKLFLESRFILFRNCNETRACHIKLLLLWKNL